MKNLQPLKILIFIFFQIFILTNCTSKSNNDSEYDDIDNYDSDNYGSDNYDGTYCAEITYYNPNTNNSSTYDLEIEVENNELVRILWPNGGWLDQDHFNPVEFNEDGYCEFTSDKNYEYTIQIVNRNCSRAYQNNRTHNQSTEDRTICPNCGEEKDEYDELCSDCEYENY